MELGFYCHADVVVSFATDTLGLNMSAQPIVTDTSMVHLVDNLNVGGLPPNSYHC